MWLQFINDFLYFLCSTFFGLGFYFSQNLINAFEKRASISDIIEIPLQRTF